MQFFGLGTDGLWMGRGRVLMHRDGVPPSQFDTSHFASTKPWQSRNDNSVISGVNRSAKGSADERISKSLYFTSTSLWFQYASGSNDIYFNFRILKSRDSPKSRQSFVNCEGVVGTPRKFASVCVVQRRPNVVNL